MSTQHQDRTHGTASHTSIGGGSVIRIVAAALLALAVFISSEPKGILAASPSADRPAAAPARQVASLEAAVAAGLLDPEVANVLTEAGEVRTIVSFDADATLRRAAIEAPSGAERAKAMVESLQRGFGTMKSRALQPGPEVEIVDALASLPNAIVTFRSEAALLRTLRDADVVSVSLPGSGTAMLTESRGMVRQPEMAAAGYRGAGTYVAVIDTGTDFTRAAFGSCGAAGGSCKVAEALDFAPNDGSLDDNGHGTNVAGIVLGVAPATRILSYDVFKLVGFDAMGNPVHEYDDTWVLSALATVASRKATMNIAAVNLSLGVRTTYHDAECRYLPNGTANPYAATIATLRQLGIAPVFAAGNDAAANGAFHSGVSYPSCTPGAIRVGAVFDDEFSEIKFETCTNTNTRPDSVTCFSQNSRALLTVFAPGSHITAAGISQSGTSQAAPHVAGAFAVLKAARPSASLDGIQTAISTTGPLVGDDRFGDPFWKRRLDIVAAFNALPASDTTKPVVSGPTQALPSGTTVTTGGGIAVRANWSATDASGIAAYAIQLSVNGTWYDYSSYLSSPTATSLTFTGMAPGTAYAFAVAARDGAGNWSAWKVGPTFTAASIAENATGVAYAGASWRRVAWASALGGYLTVGATAGDSVSYTFTGRNVAWVATSATNRGAAKVYLDGVLVKTIDLYSATTTARRVQYSASFATSGTHTLKVVVVGTAGRPAVDVDGFIVLK